MITKKRKTYLKGLFDLEIEEFIKILLVLSKEESNYLKMNNGYH